MDSISTRVGHVVKFLVLFMIAVLTYNTISRFFFDHPNKWALEITQFINGSFYMVGGAFVLLIGGQVRMDIFYEKWSAKKKAVFDIVTFIFSFTFLGVLIIGGVSSTMYALRYGQTSYSAWGPPMAPIKIIVLFGIILMFLQTIAELIKDIAIAREEDTSWIHRPEVEDEL
ncbi:MAG: TRAP transporter small permease subunit [Spirochaetales bacterium]|nr:TRAP transporter small permease subunit [Spirochaetales bacterium]